MRPPENKTATIYPTTVAAEFSVDIGNSHYLVIYGTHINGGFCCIPNWNFSCELGNADDVAYNAEKLECRFQPDIALSLATLIKNVVAEVSARSILNKNWRDLMPDISTRAHNCLMSNDHPMRNGKALNTIEDIVTMKTREIYQMRNCGQRTRAEIALKLQDLGIKKTDWFEFLPTKGHDTLISSPPPIKPEKPAILKSSPPQKTENQFREILEKYFGDEECRNIWESQWSKNLQGHNAVVLYNLEAQGLLTEENLKKIRRAILDRNYNVFIDLPIERP